MKQILHKKTRKPSHKENRACSAGCAMMQATFHLMGY